MPNKLTWLVLASIAAIAVVGVASAQAPQPLRGRNIPGQQIITCPPTAPGSWIPKRPDGWRQGFNNGWFMLVQYDQALHRIMCHYHVNPGDGGFTWLEWLPGKELVNCRVAPDGKSVVCDRALPLAPRMRP